MREKKKRKWFILFGWLVLILLLVVVYCKVKQQKEEKAEKEEQVAQESQITLLQFDTSEVKQLYYKGEKGEVTLLKEGDT